MPPIDYTIPGQFQRVQLEPPENAMARVMQLRGLQEAAQMNALKMQEYQRAREEENALRQLFASGLKPDSEEFRNQLYARAPGLAPNIEKGLLERSKTAAEVKYKEEQRRKEAAETLSKKLEFHRQMFNPLAVTTPDQAAAHTAAFYENPDFAPYANKMMSKAEAMVQSRELFAKNKFDWLKTQVSISGDKILEATERREKERANEENEAYETDRINRIYSGLPEITKAEFLAARNAPVAVDTAAAPRPAYTRGLLGPAAAPAPEPEPAPAPAPAAAPAPAPAAAPIPAGEPVTVEGRRVGLEYVDPVAQRFLQLAANAKTPAQAAAFRETANKIQAEHVRAIEAQREVTKPPTSIQELREYLKMTPEEKAAYEKLQKIKATNVSASASANSPTGKSLAAEVGQRANTSLVKAEGAVGIMESANMVREALNAGNVIAGPLAGVRTKFAQVLELAGAGDKQKLINTRAAIQGLATMTLESRAELKGQGQVTENEQKLLERARSGNIEDMTIAELQQVVNVSQRLANRLWSSHQTLLKRMETDPAAVDSLRYYYPTVTLPSAVSEGKPKDESNKRAQALDKIFRGK